MLGVQVVRSSGVHRVLHARRSARWTVATTGLLLVHAKDETAAEFYQKHGFEQVLGDPLKLFLPVQLSS